LIEIPGEQTTNSNALTNYWHIILAEYQNRVLKFDKDNLTALVGAAEYMQGRADWIYLSGGWKHDIPRGLLWERTVADGSHPLNGRFDHCHAPSWSWSSVDGSTKMAPEMFDAVGMVIDLQMNPRTYRMTTRDTYCTLIYNVSLEISAMEGWGINPLPESAALQLYGRVLIECQCTGEGPQCKIAAYRGSVIRARGSIWFDVPSKTHEDSVWCLPLASVAKKNKPLVQTPANPGANPQKSSSIKDRLQDAFRNISSRLRPKPSVTAMTHKGGEDGDPPSSLKCLRIGLRKIGTDFQRVGFVRLTLLDRSMMDETSQRNPLLII
jgi:hypothetical protein